jgi:3-oxoacyl-[acyl-carrier-protein] synthase II
MMVRNDGKRVVITGVGPVTPVGIGKEAYWESLIQGRSFFRRIEFPNRDMTQYRCQIAAPIEGFDLFQYVDRIKHSKHIGRTAQFAIAAAWLALRDSSFELEKNEQGKDGHTDQIGLYQMKGIDSFQAGIILGVGVESMELVEHYHERFLSKGVKDFHPLVFLTSI